MSNKVVGVLLILGGAALLFVGMFADSLGIGVSTNPVGADNESQGVGWKQVLAIVVGAALVVGGLIAAGRLRRSPRG
jgi:hypothetical protein